MKAIANPKEESMAKAPVMPLWTDALIGDTTHLSTEQFGAYVLILIATWRNNGKALPDDDARMSKICKIGVTKWRRKVRPILREFFDVNESGWHQQRLEKEWVRVCHMLTQRQRAAKAGGIARGTAKRVPQAQQSINHIKTNPSSSSLPSSARAFATREGYRTRGDGTWKTIGSVLGQLVPTAPEAIEDRVRVDQQQQHMSFLQSDGGPGELELYYEAAMSDDAEARQRMFDLTEAKMREREDREIAA